MASAKKLPSGSWRVLVYDHTDTNGKRHYKSFTSKDPSARGKRDVERQAAVYAAEKERRADSSSMTVGEAMEAYTRSRSDVLSPGTVRTYKDIRRKNLQGLMDIPINNLTQEDVQNEINKEAETHSPKSIRNMHGLLTATLKAYRPDFALRTTLPQKVRPKLYVPTDAEIAKVIETASGTDMEIPILLAAFGPMRRGEICALDSDHVHGNIVHVEYSLIKNDAGEYVRKAPKSYAGNRYIEYPDFVAEKLEGIEGRIVQMLPYQISLKFSKLLDKAGVHHFRFHDLRHYSASVLHAMGIPDAYIMKRGGWSSDAVLKSVYRHVLEDQDAVLNEKINQHFEELCNTKCNTKK